MGVPLKSITCNRLSGLNANASPSASIASAPDGWFVIKHLVIHLLVLNEAAKDNTVALFPGSSMMTDTKNVLCPRLDTRACRSHDALLLGSTPVHIRRSIWR